MTMKGARPMANVTYAEKIFGARVSGNTVVLSVKGGNAEARRLCGEIVAEIDKGRNDTKRGA